jgi:small-conductance mechanosensitive channel
VIEINAMATVLLTEQDELVSVPNTTFVREPIVNTSPQAWKELTVPITVRSTVDLPAFESALLKSLAKLRSRLDPRFPPVLATKARSTQSTDLTLTLMIRRAEDRDAILGEASKRIAEVTAAVQAGGREAA